jgi:hypothetical protein
MPDTEPTKPEERVRRIEEETKHLDGQIDRAAEAVRRALQADSLEGLGTTNSEPSRPAPRPKPEAEREREEVERPESAKADESEGT